MTSRTKIKDIARRAGVSPATVSRALSDSALVAEPTRQRIQEMARALNYRPNASARSLRTRRSMAVLMVVRNIGNPFYLEILKGVETTARNAGYSVLMGNTEDNSDRELEYFEMLNDGHADGMILMTGNLPERDGFLERLSGAPVVVALEAIEESGWPHVMIDNAAAARAAVRHLIDLGHRRIAHITGPMPEVMSVRRRDGYREAMQEAGLAVPEGYEQRGDYLLATGEALCRKLFSLAVPPTAIFAANDEMAFGVINELRRMGREVPRDVSVVGFDDLFLSQAFHPPLTTVSQPRTEIGQQAMDLLLSVMAGEDSGKTMVELPTALTIRGSTGPAKQS